MYLKDLDGFEGHPLFLQFRRMRVEKKTGVVEDGEARAEIAERLSLRILPFFFAQWPDRGILKKQDQAGEPFMGKDPEEWFRQADYDLETAEDLFNGG